MILKVCIAFLLLQIVSASLEEGSNTAAVTLPKRSLGPETLGTRSEVAATPKNLHLSVTTGTPGVWYPGTGAPFDPHFPLTYWTASDSSGQFPSAAHVNGSVYVSSDFGVTWTPTGPSRAHTSIASDATGNKLVVTVNNEGVYISSDRGVSWTLANITGASDYRWPEVASDHSGQHLTAIAAVDYMTTLFYSHDFGATWNTTTSPCFHYDYDEPASAIAMSHDGQYQYASFLWCAARSTDFGATWTQLTTGARNIACSGNGEKVVATMVYGSNIMGSTDYGETWTTLNNPSEDWRVTYGSVVMDTSGQNIVVGGLSVRVVIGSADGGATWSYITPAGGSLKKNWPFRMVGDSAANHLLIAQDLMTTVNPLVTASLPESVPTAKPTAQPPLGYEPSAELSVRLFNSTQDAQFFLVPANVSFLKVTLYAGSGGNNSWTTESSPGKGGMISSIIPVTPGEVLMVMVGSAGTGEEGGFNGGGNGNGGGGGATDIRRTPYTLTDRVLIAGGGGGGSYFGAALGGDGGLEASSGLPGEANYLQSDYAPPGGNHLKEPACYNYPINNPGPLGEGCGDRNSGGGGGYYGGAGGGWSSGGGGGSSYSLYSVVDEATGYNVGDGYAVLEWKVDSAVSFTAAPSLHPVASPTTQPGMCPIGSTWLTNSCVACPAGTYAGSGFTTCMPCPAGTYSGAWAGVCTVSPAGFFSLQGAAQAIMCPAGTVSEAGASSCTACPVGQYSYPGSSTCLSCSST